MAKKQIYPFSVGQKFYTSTGYGVIKSIGKVKKDIFVYCDIFSDTRPEYNQENVQMRDNHVITLINNSRNWEPKKQ